MNDSNKIIEAYISKLFEVQRARENQPLTDEELKEIALDAGMTEEDWQAAQEAANDHNARAEGFLKYKNWSEAVNEYAQALSIRPLDTQLLSGIAYGLKMRWHTTHDPQDRDRALTYARQCLQVSPENAQSLMIVSELSAQSEAKSIKAPTSFNVKKIALVLGLVVVAGLFWFNLRTEEAPPVNYHETIANEPSTSTSSSAPLPSGLVANNNGQALEIKELSRTFKTLFGNRTSHHSTCSFTNTGQAPITRLKLRVTWYDKNQREIVSNNFYVLKEGDQPLVAGATKEYTIKQSFPQGMSQQAYQYHLVASTASNF